MKRQSLPILMILCLASCGNPPNDHWLGYIEGEMALIPAPQPGWITSINVARGTWLKQGDALFTLDAIRELAARDNANAQIAGAKEQASQASAQIAQAQAQQAQIDADIARNQKELTRQEELVRIGGTPRRDLEAAQAAYDSARAQRAQAVGLQTQATAARRQAEAQARQGEANLATAEFNLSERSVHALVAGQVQDIYFRQGEYANAGTPVVEVLPPENVFVRFFVPEAQVARLTLGSQVHISCDSCPPNLVGTISFIAAQAEFTPPVIYSVENRERLVFKVEARVANGLPSRPGLPAEVWPVETAAAPAPAK
ncbi:MAG TPA: HlyD family efflux transporter periplasmic adaptor subunit [Micropepsaceae bacterium]|nr:HlyD family efflux transporter periplasmic adaptor subunit [Micropepsaceae bacterium]